MLRSGGPRRRDELDKLVGHLIAQVAAFAAESNPLEENRARRAQRIAVMLDDRVGRAG